MEQKKRNSAVRCTGWLGATVRLRKGRRTAIVVSDNVTIGNSQVEGGVRLGGLRYWNIEDLVMVAPNAEVIHRGNKPETDI